MRSVRIVLDEEKILREGKYKLDELYAYLDEIAKEAKLTKQDKFNYLSSGDEDDLTRIGIFTIHNAVENEAITQNVKEWLWLIDGVPYINVIEKLKNQGLNLTTKDNQIVEPKKFFKYIKFALSTEELKRDFSDETERAYKLIDDFFLERDFEYRMPSIYVSKKPLDDYDMSDFLKTFGGTFIWLKDCLEMFEITDMTEKERENLDFYKQLIIKAAQKAKIKQAKKKKSNKKKPHKK